MIDLIAQRRTQLDALCVKHGVQRLFLFGSALRKDFDRAKSDLDFIVAFGPSTTNLADRYLGLLVDLEDLFGLEIDLVSEAAIRNPYFRQVVDQTRVPLYAA